MKSVLARVERSGITLIIGAVCFLLGVLVSMPLGWKLSDPVLTLLGLVAGVAGSIGGALILWKVQERRQGNTLIAAMNVLLLHLLDEINDIIEEFTDPAFSGEMINSTFVGTVDAAHTMASSMRDRLHVLPPQAALHTLNVERSLRAVRELAHVIQQGSQQQRAALGDELRSALISTKQEIGAWIEMYMKC